MSASHRLSRWTNIADLFPGFTGCTGLGDLARRLIGKHYIVLETADDICVLPYSHMVKRVAHRLLDDEHYFSWVYMRAFSPEDAKKHAIDAQDQWRAHTNGIPNWKEIVRLPVGERC